MKRSLWNPQGQAETSSLQNVLRTDTACFPLSQGRWQSHCGAPTGRREGAAVDVLLHVPQASLLEPQELIQQALKAQGPGGLWGAHFSAGGWRGPKDCQFFAQRGPPFQAPRDVRDTCSPQRPGDPGSASSLLALGGHGGFDPMDQGWNSPKLDGQDCLLPYSHHRGFPSSALWGTPPLVLPRPPSFF